MSTNDPFDKDENTSSPLPAYGTSAQGQSGGYGAQYPPPGTHGAAKPPSNLWWGIFCLVCCCLPFGIVSIIYATKVDGLTTAGNIAEAQDASDKARMWALIGIGCGVLVGLAYLVLGVLVGFDDGTTGASPSGL